MDDEETCEVCGTPGVSGGRMIRYIVRWALTRGIVKRDGEYVDDGKYFRSNTRSSYIFVSEKEAFETLEQAVECAKEMARKKSVSLRKKADALGALSWAPKVVEL